MAEMLIQFFIIQIVFFITTQLFVISIFVPLGKASETVKNKVFCGTLLILISITVLFLTGLLYIKTELLIRYLFNIDENSSLLVLLFEDIMEILINLLPMLLYSLITASCSFIILPRLNQHELLSRLKRTKYKYVIFALMPFALWYTLFSIRYIF